MLGRPEIIFIIVGIPTEKNCLSVFFLDNVPSDEVLSCYEIETGKDLRRIVILPSVDGEVLGTSGPISVGTLVKVLNFPFPQTDLPGPLSFNHFDHSTH